MVRWVMDNQPNPVRTGFSGPERVVKDKLKGRIGTYPIKGVSLVRQKGIRVDGCRSTIRQGVHGLGRYARRNQ